MKYLSRGSFVLLLLLVACSRGPKKILLCPGLEIDIPASFRSFDESEKKLICGDPKNPDWKEIPRGQMLYHLKIFLNERGFFESEIKEEPLLVRVKAGERHLLEKITITGWPAPLPPFPQHHFLGRVMKPRLLDEVENQLLTVLKSNAYPCPKVKVEADVARSQVTITVDSGKAEEFRPMDIEPNDEIEVNALRRFDAFLPDQPYDFRLLELSEQRTRLSGFVQDQNLLPRCENDNFKILQKTTAGKTRFFSIGAGFDTEQFLISRARLSFGRLSRRGSNLRTEILASYRIQSLKNIARVHPWTAERKDYLYFKLEGENRNEKNSVSFAVRTGLGYGREFESRAAHWVVQAGPQFEYAKVTRGPGPGEARGISYEATVDVQSHDEEYYASQPRAGIRAGFAATHHPQVLGANFSASSLRLNSTLHHQLVDGDRYDLILSLRGFVAATRGWGESGDEEIPLTARYFLGGSQDLRGFGRLELPGNGQGALSAAYFGSELRLMRLFALEPILFLDVGALGNRSFVFRPPYYVSPGFGVRWRTAFGTLRGTAAYGYSVGEPEREEKKSHAQFFVSFGEEF